jgi:hypothetical protein
MVNKIAAVLLISGVIALSFWIFLSAPFFTADVHVDYPTDYTGERMWSGMYLLEYPAVLLWLLVIGVILVTLGISRVIWRLKPKPEMRAPKNPDSPPWKSNSSRRRDTNFSKLTMFLYQL